MSERKIGQGPLEVEKLPVCEFPGCEGDAVYELTGITTKGYCEAHADTVQGIFEAMDSSHTPARRKLETKAPPQQVAG